MENEVQLSLLPRIERQVQTCRGARFRDLLDSRRENLKIMRKAMLITLLLTTMAGFGAIKIRAIVLENGTVRSFLGKFNGDNSMDQQAGQFEFMPPGQAFGGPFLGTMHPSHRHRAWQAQMLPGVQSKTVDQASGEIAQGSPM